ncbi:MAG: PKD domain-containing protein [Bacteroidota bacterium]
MKKFLLFIFSLVYYQCFSQGNIITIGSNLPTQISVCGTAKVFTITIYNPSPFTVTNDTLKLTMPSGMAYQVGSVTGAGVTELNTSIPNKPVFLLPPIIPLAPALSITITASANCNIITYIAGGGVVENKIRVDYTANSSQNYDNHTTLTYAVKQPVLNITNITNQSYTANIGDIYTRCITITNSGLGDLTQFTLTDIHGAGIQINSVNKGVWVNSGSTETVTFNASHFSSVGNNNGLFEQGESIVICETVKVNNCFLVASDLTAAWGCNNQVCQSSTMGANVLFPNLIPNIEVTPLSPDMNPCLGPGKASLQRLMIVNKGLGQASNIQLDIFQSTGSGYSSSMGSNIDESSFNIQIDSGAITTVSPDSTEITEQVNCMPANSKGRVFLTIPVLNAGDTAYLQWNTYSCCYNGCTSTGQSYFNGWAFRGSYSNFCQSAYIISQGWGRVYSQLYGVLNNNSSPSTLDSGQVGAFNFKFSSYGLQAPYPGDASAYWKFVFTLPPCLVGSTNPFVLNGSGSGPGTWNPTTVTTTGNIITAIFNGMPPFDLNQAQVKINLAVDCNGCSGGFGSVDIQVIYVPSVSCACEVAVSCQSAPVSILCATFIVIPVEPDASVCPEGMMVRNYLFERTSYGRPDNEPGGGNGIPDPTGNLNFSSIKTNRAMFGDTISESYHGKVRTSIAHPFWVYCYINTSITNGNLLTYLDAKLTVFRAGALVATCTNFSAGVATTGTTRTFSYNLSVAGLISSGCMPAGFKYLNSDSLVFIPRYKVTTNTTGPIYTAETTNEFYLTDVTNPPPGFNRYQCDGFFSRCFIMGYRFETKDDSYYTVKSCENITISQKYYLSIGPCCSNYNGGNLFPSEYRNWAHISNLTVTIPPGYKFVSAQFKEDRTAGSGTSVTSAAIALTPLYADTTLLVFPVENYFDGYTGTLPLSDDGFSGTLDVIIEPSCEVTPVLSQGIKYDWTFSPTGYLTGSGSYPTSLSATQDYIIYDAPSFFLQSILPSVNAPDSSAIWEVTLSNPSNTSNTENSWISCPVISGVTVVDIFDLDNNVSIPATGNIYQLGTVNAATIRSFRVTGNFTSCFQDSIIIYAGWNCSEGYPADLASYPCLPGKITLKETPLIPALDISVATTPGTPQLCDTTDYTVEVLNFQAGTLYNALLTTILPVGVVIVPGSSKLSYPQYSPYGSIPNPVLISGTTWQWDLSAINSLIGSNGLKGYLDSTLNMVKVTFKIVTNCNYSSGNNIQFNIKGKAACGLPVNQNLVPPIQLVIAGAIATYTTDIFLSTTYISPCAANSVMHVNAINLGPAALGATDSIVITLPNGVSYENNSFAGIHNAPANPVPVQSMLNGQRILKWKMPLGLQAGDSVVFDFNYAGTPDAISCGISYFQVSTLSIANVVCTSTGSACDINVVNGSDTLAVFAYKAYLSLSDPSGYSVPNPPAGETATISFNINNTGQDIFPVNDVVISYYFDSNGNGVYNTGDVFVVNDTLNASIPQNGSYPYSSSVFLPAGNSCSVIAVLDTSINHCSCISDQLAITIPMTQAAIDTSVCSGQTITLGYPLIAGYIYSWTAATGLSNLNSSEPTFAALNNSGLPVINNFEVTINRINCISKDTVMVSVNPNPLLSISAPDTICTGENNGTATVGVTGSGAAPYTYLWNTSPPQLNDTATALSGGIYSVTVTDTNGCSASQTITIIEPATAIIAAITAQLNLNCNGICNGTATVTASGGTPGYTYSWNTIPVQITSAANSLCAGNYSIVVTDMAGCDTTATLTITEPAALTASIAVLSGTCNIGNNAVATVTASGGTGAYTYLWNNGQTTNTITGLSPGTYSVTVSDSNSCVQTFSAIVTPAVAVTVNAISTNICQGQSTTITASASGGTPNYLFLWNTLETTESITVSPMAATTYTVIVTDANGCQDSVTLPITVRSSPVVDFQPDSAGCSPLCISFQDLSTIATGINQQWFWDFGDGTLSNLTNPFHCFENNTIYSQITNTVKLTVTSNDGCSTTLVKNDYITVNPIPVADFNYSPRPATILSPLISFQNESLGASIWQWDFSIGLQDSTSTLQHPYYTYNDTGQFEVTLIVNNNYGCTDTIQKTILIGLDWVIYIPNAFTPNGDEINDFFPAKAYGIIDFEMFIFDRWGNLIYQTDDIKKTWDGKANHGNELAQSDVYVYTVKITDFKKIKHKYRGVVTLVR